MNVVHLAPTGWTAWLGDAPAVPLPSVLHALPEEGGGIRWSVAAGRKKTGLSLDLRRELERVHRLAPPRAAELFARWWELQSVVPGGPALLVAPLAWLPALAREIKARVAGLTFVLEDLALLAGLSPLPDTGRSWVKRYRGQWLLVEREADTFTLVGHAGSSGSPRHEPDPEVYRTGAALLQQWIEGGPRSRFRLRPSLTLIPAGGTKAWATLQPPPGPFSLEWSLSTEQELDVGWSLADGTVSLLQRQRFTAGRWSLLGCSQHWILESGSTRVCFAGPAMAV